MYCVLQSLLAVSVGQIVECRFIGTLALASIHIYGSWMDFHAQSNLDDQPVDGK